MGFKILAIFCLLFIFASVALAKRSKSPQDVRLEWHKANTTDGTGSYVSITVKADANTAEQIIQTLQNMKSGSQSPAPIGCDANVPQPIGGGVNVPVPIGGGANVPQPIGGGVNVPVPIGGGANVPQPIGGGVNVPVPIGGGAGTQPPGIGSGVDVPKPITWKKCPQSNVECASTEVCVYERFNINRYTCRKCKKNGISHKCSNSKVECCENERCEYDRFSNDHYKCTEI